MSVIEIKNLVKKYGNNVAVDNLNLNIEKGKVYGFLGPNGAGKSTTMNIITGYIGASSGTVTIDGNDIFKEPEKAKKCIGYLPELPPLYQDMTVEEYLRFVAELKQIPKKDRLDSVEKVLEMTQTKEVEKRLIRNLSKGFKQRVGIAQAILGMPEVIILDEPTVGLDPNQIIEIRQLIKKLGENHTVILSSHILSEISEVCEHIFIISKGKLVASGTEQELVEEMAGNNELTLEIKGDEAQIEQMLNGIDDICNYEFTNTKNSEVLKVNITGNKHTDIREKLFYACAEQKTPILAMEYNQMDLEDIFIELTQDKEDVTVLQQEEIIAEDRIDVSGDYSDDDIEAAEAEDYSDNDVEAAEAEDYSDDDIEATDVEDYIYDEQEDDE